MHDYVIKERRCGITVHHRRYGPEVSVTADGEVALAIWPSAEAAMAAIRETYRDPELPSTPPPPQHHPLPGAQPLRGGAGNLT